MNLSNLTCCCRKLQAAGLVASCFKVRCMRSWRPFCWGWPGLMRLDGDAETQPPHGELAQPEQGLTAGERYAVVGANSLGHAEVAEHALEDCERIAFLGAGQRLAAEQEAGGEVGNGQRVAVATIGEHELAFVVGAPQIVRSQGPRQRGARGLVATFAAPLDQA